MPTCLPCAPADAAPAPAFSAPAAAFARLDVAGTLLACGETLKASGSSQWTVMSDARLKDVVATFDLGVGELVQLRPKVFKYKDGVTDDPEREYVGLIAQEVPEALARYCRQRAMVRLQPTDEEVTEIFLLDHSCLQFVCINAVNEVDQRLGALGARLSEVERRLAADPKPAPEKQQPRPFSLGAGAKVWTAVSQPSSWHRGLLAALLVGHLVGSMKQGGEDGSATVVGTLCASAMVIAYVMQPDAKLWVPLVAQCLLLCLFLPAAVGLYNILAWPEDLVVARLEARATSPVFPVACLVAGILIAVLGLPRNLQVATCAGFTGLLAFMTGVAYLRLGSSHTKVWDIATAFLLRVTLLPWTGFLSSRAVSSLARPCVAAAQVMNEHLGSDEYEPVAQDEPEKVPSILGFPAGFRQALLMNRTFEN